MLHELPSANTVPEQQESEPPGRLLQLRPPQVPHWSWHDHDPPWHHRKTCGHPRSAGLTLSSIYAYMYVLLTKIHVTSARGRHSETDLNTRLSILSLTKQIHRHFNHCQNVNVNVNININVNVKGKGRDPEQSTFCIIALTSMEQQTLPSWNPG